MSVGVAVASGALVQAAAATTSSVANAKASWLCLGEFNGLMENWLSERAGLSKRIALRKRSGSNTGRLLAKRIELLHHELRDSMPRVRRWTQRPEQLHGGLHKLDLRDVFGLVESQELDDVFVRDRSFHRTLSFVPE